MPSLAIIINFYIPKDISPGLFTGFVFIMIKHFAFYCNEEGFSTGIVITVALTAHAADLPPSTVPLIMLD